jgi:uncharacterized protein
MLSYDIRELERHGVQVAGELGADDPIWGDDDTRPVAPIRVTGRLSNAGSGRYYWSGRIEGIAEQECRRCLTDLSVDVAEDASAIFVEAGDDVSTDPDIYTLPPNAEKIDLRPVVRDQWVLSAPTFVLCREACKGLCPKCGADLNEGPCDCAAVTESDSRWDALRAARPSSD